VLRASNISILLFPYEFFLGKPMASIFDIIQSQLGDQQLSEIAEKIGADKSQTRDAVSMTIPALIEALGRRTEQVSQRQSPTTKGSSRDSGSLLDQLNRQIGVEGGSRPFDSSTSTSKTNASIEPRSNSREILPPSTPPSKPTQTQASELDDFLNEILGSRRTPSPSTPTAPPSSDKNSVPDIFGDLLGKQHGRVADSIGKSSGLNPQQSGSLLDMLGPLLGEALGSHAKKEKLSPEDLTKMIQKDRARVQASPSGGMLGRLFDQDGDGDFDFSDLLKLGMSFLGKK
jgi:hypothetical protein